MCPITHESFLALGVAVVVAFIFGFLWYGPLFGKIWAGLMGFNTKDCKDKKPPMSSLLLMVLCNLLNTVALAYILNIYKAPCAFGVAFLVWIGFYVPLQLGPILWERKPWKLFGLNAVYSFLHLQIIAAILTYIR